MVDMQPSVLKPQDVAIALKILLLENQEDLTEDSILQTWTLAQLAKATHISIGKVHNAISRLKESRLIRSERRQINRHALEEFLIHGARYAFPAKRGSAIRGLPTAYAAPALKEQFVMAEQETPVWPYIEGTVRGIAFSPLYKKAPEAALEDRKFYELLAIKTFYAAIFVPENGIWRRNFCRLCWPKVCPQTVPNFCESKNDPWLMSILSL